MKKTFSTIFIIIFIGLIFLASGYGRKVTNESTQYYTMPEGLEDCKVFELHGENNNWITVVRCPLSITTTTEKNSTSTKTTTVIEK